MSMKASGSLCIHSFFEYGYYRIPVSKMYDNFFCQIVSYKFSFDFKNYNICLQIIKVDTCCMKNSE